MASQRFLAIFVGVSLYFTWSSAAEAQISNNAYRVLGQPDLQQNGVNMVQGLEMNAPVAVAVDARDGALHLYISDRRNNRVLAWRDAVSSQIGDPATLVLGQPTPQQTTTYGIGAKGFNGPAGLAVDPVTGNLYVADTGNNRVLRFPAPFANLSRVEPDAVYGQSSFTSLSANPVGIIEVELKKPGSGAAAGSSPLDPVKIDPKHYKVQFENDQVRVVRVRFGPHEMAPLHEHSLNRVVVYLADQNFRITSADGAVEMAQHKRGEVSWGGPTKHKEENLNDKPMEVVVVELK